MFRTNESRSGNRGSRGPQGGSRHAMSSSRRPGSPQHSQSQQSEPSEYYDAQEVLAPTETGSDSHDSSRDPRPGASSTSAAAAKKDAPAGRPATQGDQHLPHISRKPRPKPAAVHVGHFRSRSGEASGSHSRRPSTTVPPETQSSPRQSQSNKGKTPRTYEESLFEWAESEEVEDQSYVADRFSDIRSAEYHTQTSVSSFGAPPRPVLDISVARWDPLPVESQTVHRSQLYGNGRSSTLPVGGTGLGSPQRRLSGLAQSPNGYQIRNFASFPTAPRHRDEPAFQHLDENETARPMGSGASRHSPIQPNDDGAIPLAQHDSESSSSSGTVAGFVSGEDQLFVREGYFTRHFETFDVLRRQRWLLRVFRSNWTKCLRFHLAQVGGERDISFELDIETHELVMGYAYANDPSWENVIYIQRKPSDDHFERVPVPLRNISLMCQFDETKDVADFQRALLGEAVSLDISNVRCVRLKISKEDKEISNCRVQIWHEDLSSAYMRTDTMSFLSNTTRLAGRPRENTRPRFTRVVIYLGRREEYLTLFVTDDIQLINEGDKGSAYRFVARMQPREQTHMRLRNKTSKPFVKVWHVQQNSHAAGFGLGGPSTNPEDESFKKCQSVEIEFEARKEHRDFKEIWKQAIQIRREKKADLEDIENRMAHEQFTGRLARQLFF